MRKERKRRKSKGRKEEMEDDRYMSGFSQEKKENRKER